jgi:hypothetical protein
MDVQKMVEVILKLWQLSEGEGDSKGFRHSCF